MEICLSADLERGQHQVACSVWGYRSPSWREQATLYPNVQAVFPHGDEEWRLGFGQRLAALTPPGHVNECLIEDMPGNGAVEVRRIAPSVEVADNAVLCFRDVAEVREFIRHWRLPTLEAAWCCVPKSTPPVLTKEVVNARYDLLYNLPRCFLNAALTGAQVDLINACHFVCVQNLDEFESADPFFFSSHVPVGQLHSVLCGSEGEGGELSTESLRAWLNRRS